MKAIMLLFVRTPHAAIPAMQLSVVSAAAQSRNGGVPGMRETNSVKQLTPPESTPPFWTWFIENPRPIKQHTATT